MSVVPYFVKTQQSYLQNFQSTKIFHKNTLNLVSTFLVHKLDALYLHRVSRYLYAM